MKYFYILIILIINSCTTHSVKNSNENPTVDIQVEQNTALKIDKSTQGTTNSYGPTLIQEDFQKQQSNQMQREPILSLHLAPAGNYFSAYVSLFQAVERQGLKIKVISAEGLSTIIAALYAKYQDASKLEWKLYALFGKIKDDKFFSSTWLNHIEEFVESEFGQLKVEQLSSLLLIPSSDFDNEKFYSNLLVSKAIMNALNISRGDQRSSLLSTKVDYSQVIKNFANSDIEINVAILPEKLIFQHPDNFLIGIYSKKIYQLANSSSKFWIMDFVEAPLDQINNIATVTNRSKESADKIAEKIFNKVKKWKKMNN